MKIIWKDAPYDLEKKSWLKQGFLERQLHSISIRNEEVIVKPLPRVPVFEIYCVLPELVLATNFYDKSGRRIEVMAGMGMVGIMEKAATTKFALDILALKIKMSVDDIFFGSYMKCKAEGVERLITGGLWGKGGLLLTDEEVLKYINSYLHS